MAINLDSPNTDEYRYERKFIVSDLTQYEIEALVKLHPAMFSEVYHARFVNNLYLDSPSRKNYADNVDGLRDRVKVRIRWYGDLFGYIEKPVLELKFKRGSVGGKEGYLLNAFSIDKCLQVATILDVFKQSDIPDDLRFKLMAMELSLLNRYRRKYFQSVDGLYRITIDTEMECYLVQSHSNTFLHKSVDRMNTVVELKYDPREDQSVEQITNHFPFRIAKNSKYVQGIDRLHLW